MAVPMDAEQELVFGWMGLSPALLLDPPPAGDNLVVRVVRPGDDAEAVLEAARQQLASSGGRRRRRGGRGGGSGSGMAAGSWRGASEEPLLEDQPAMVEITPLPFNGGDSAAQQLEPELLTVNVGAPAAAVAAAASPANGRSKAAVKSTPEAPQEATAEAPLEATAEPDDGEPRRRRRRSSATA